MIEYILGLITLIPPSIDDYKDYLVDDKSWLLSPLLLVYLLIQRRLILNDLLYIIIDLIIYCIVFVPLYLILRIKNMEFGEADLILYLILILYEPIINLGLLIPDYLIMIILINLLGLIYGIYRRIRRLDDRIPLVAFSLPALSIIYLILILKTLIPSFL